MTVNCPMCGTPAAADTPLATALQFAAYIDGDKPYSATAGAWKQNTWEGIAGYQAEGTTWNTGPRDASFDVTVIAKSVADVGEAQGNDSRVAFLVLEVNGHLLRKDGYFDSYGSDITWRGLCRPVNRLEKTTTEYVYQ